METTLIDIFDKTYELCDQIQYRAHEREAYEQLCSEVFPGLSFEKWYQAGYWDGNLFNPTVLKNGDKILSAISVNKMNILVKGTPRLYIQLGGVMTAKSHRHQGLSTAIMDKILTEWEDNCDGIYLFANESVRDFYPKFGFKTVDEYQYSMKINQNSIFEEKAIRLNMENKEDVSKLIEYSKFGNPFSALKIDNNGLLMFYCMKYNKNDVYYLEEEDAVVIAGYENESIVIYDIYCKNNISLKDIISAMANENTQTAYFGFPLIQTKHCKISKYEEEDNILFILNKAESDNLADFLFVPEMANKLMFPLLSHS